MGFCFFGPAWQVIGLGVEISALRSVRLLGLLDGTGASRWEEGRRYVRSAMRGAAPALRSLSVDLVRQVGDMAV